MAIISSMTEYEYPLVTMYVISYNQEKFAGAAVEAALLQDYPNLEIIISDDCSTDKTWDEILRIADHYHGPHKLILNRNTYNLGIGEHINRVLKMASGDIIVASAADDICGWPRKLDNLTWCKMPVKLTRKGRAFYEKVV